jgi:hypothetical protein
MSMQIIVAVILANTCCSVASNTFKQETFSPTYK